ncbi:hypothetical protein F4W67_08050 [Pseudomonas caricapapayae]|nr:hypothetical protein F4W67_08050 [Pseudomonas caricapapayae]
MRRVAMHFVTLCVTQLCKSVRFRPGFVGFLRPDTDVALCVVSVIVITQLTGKHCSTSAVHTATPGSIT